MAETNERCGRSFFWLNATQFFGALNDNVFKLLVIFYVIFTRGEEGASRAVALGSAVFVVPFLLFTPAAGVLADRISKSLIVRWAKGTEVAAMLLGAAAFGAGWDWALYAVLFLMAAQSAFFGPSKYGVVPELVPRERLSRANGYIQAFTYLAIILGTAAAPALSRLTRDNYFVASLFCVVVSALGLIASFPMEKTPPAGSQRRISVFFLKDIWRTLSDIRRDRFLILPVLASSYFLLLGGFMQLNLIPFAINELGLTKETGSYLFLLAAVGIGLGSLLAGRLSGRNVEIGIIPIGAIGLTVASVSLGLVPAWVEPGSRTLPWPMPGLHEIPNGVVSSAWWIFLLGISSGLFIVPMQAWLQFRSPARERGEILAASGWLSWVGVLVASGLVYLFNEPLGLAPRQGFVIMGVLTLVLSVCAVRALPDFLLRFVALLVTRLLYRVRVVGARNIPIEGPALLVCNHVSWVDAVLLISTQQRRIRFIAHRDVCRLPWLRPAMRLMRVIPISERDAPRALVAALKEARAALDSGFLVCIFAEGALTRTGVMRAFRSGFEHIVKGTDYPIVPVYLGGAWGSIFSYRSGRVLSRLPRRIPYPVTVLFGRPLPPSSTSFEVRQAVRELSCDYFDGRRGRDRSLPAQFVRTARRRWGRPAVADSTGQSLTYGRALAGALALGEIVGAQSVGQEMVGILLPPSVGAVLANLAVSLLGKVPVNLNYTASAEGLRSAVRQCRLETVVTSRRFLHRLKGLPNLQGALYLEDVRRRIGDADRRRAWLRARFAPRSALLAGVPSDPDRLATVIFSSGSTGEPKGVMLSHHNILSNVEACRTIMRLHLTDCVCGILPFFHSFGFTACLWLPLLTGFRAAYHVNPLEPGAVGKLARERGATLLFATPTFLQAYLRRTPPDDFATLRVVVAGAEKLKARLAQAFEERFGLRPLEGYGATELSPVVALNVPDRGEGGARQDGARQGTVGHPLPGVAVRIVDPESRKPLPPGEPGLMLVRGANVMMGYLGQPEETRKVLRDGWYDTGDIAFCDPDGFIHITDRLSRFSKIGGEMVPHLAVEEALQEGLRQAEQVVAVTAVPDERKGERLVVLYTPAAGSAEALHETIQAGDLPNLWRPHSDAYVAVESLPLLGSGKLDLRGLKKLALAGRERAGA